ncbi:FAD-binding oxidoreductase [Nocardioides terrisoli]|uniref:FAD-binding oxidoreductase n=1 Tax=Nocardioides terrisoli TaxID=3388267 RepID=UPI00287BAF87|nr:FAD-binding protein [Nocardioides marmorisolisilvae]
MRTNPSTLGRRALLIAGAAGLVAGCSGGPGATVAAPAAGSTPRLPSSPPSSTGPVPWGDLRRHVRGLLRRPGDAGYNRVRRTENPRYDDNHPLAVLTVASASDVAIAVTWARDHGVPVAVRSGGHSYPGWSAGGAPGTGMPSALVLDCRDLDRVAVHPSGTASIGAGAALARVYDVLGNRGRALAGGSCATVGISGLALGGGVGVLTRAMGLTCDAMRSLEVVTADGRLRVVDPDRHPDLFWALRGGGGGHLGVVTSLRFATTAAPTLTTFYLGWPFSAAARVIEAWQDWAPDADPRLWSTLKALGGGAHPGGPTLLLSGTWTGPTGTLDRQLAGLLAHAPAPSVRTTHVRGYHEAMMTYAGCATIPASRCHTGPGGSLTREAFAATSHVGYEALPSAGIAELLGEVERAQSSGLHEAGISMDALGGHVRDLSPTETAFVHRRALMTVQYTATYSGQRGHDASAYVRRFRSTLMPYWGDHAYVNYADRAVRHHRTAYFGANAARLAAVKRAYDPDNFFDQPQGY